MQFMGHFFGFPPLKSSRPLDSLQVDSEGVPQLARETVNQFLSLRLRIVRIIVLGRTIHPFSFSSLDILRHNTLDQSCL
jgi:hypothetical protein